MNRPLVLLLACSFLSFHSLVPPRATAQSSAGSQPAPTASGLLQQAATAAGGAQALTAVTNVTGTGSITYNRASAAVSGSASLTWSNSTGLIFESTTSDGKRTLTATVGSGSIVDERGRTLAFGSHNASRMQFEYLPSIELAAVSNSPAAVVQAGPQVSLAAGPADVVMVSGYWPTNGQDSADETVIFYLDHTTHLVVRRDDYLEAAPYSPGRLPREIDYSGYQEVNGVYLPSTISETLNQQPLYTITFTQLTTQ